MVALRRAKMAVFFVAFGVLAASCAGGPTSDWPTQADDDDEDGPVTMPPGLDAGSGSGFFDAAAPMDEAGRDAGVADAGDAAADAELPDVRSFDGGVDASSIADDAATDATSP